METGEMVITDQDGGVCLKDNGSVECERPDYLLRAQRLRGKLTDLRDGIGEPPALGLRIRLDSSIWRNLPTELLQLVLARLALPEIPRLRFLSNEWKTSIATANSEFNRACDEANPRMVALLSYTLSPSEFWVRIFDLNKNTWYGYSVSPGGKFDRELVVMSEWGMSDGCDEGLVCFISTRRPRLKAEPQLCIVVMNPLTRVHHELPPLHDMSLYRPTMVQITVDSETKCYKVIAAGNKKGPVPGTSPLAAIYDSRSRQWTKVAQSPGLIFGQAHRCLGGTYDNFTFKSRIPFVYNFAEGQLELRNEKSISAEASVKSYTFVKDHFFVLHEEIQDRDAGVYCITEYHAESRGKNWVHVKNHRCTPFDYLPDEYVDMDLHACGGVLMVSARPKQQFDEILIPLEHELAWLLDLCTGEWRALPECPQEAKPVSSDSYMCTPSWNLIP